MSLTFCRLLGVRTSVSPLSACYLVLGGGAVSKCAEVFSFFPRGCQKVAAIKYFSDVPDITIRAARRWLTLIFLLKFFYFFRALLNWGNIEKKSTIRAYPSELNKKANFSKIGIFSEEDFFYWTCCHAVEYSEIFQVCDPTLGDFEKRVIITQMFRFSEEVQLDLEESHKPSEGCCLNEIGLWPQLISLM